MSKKINYSYIIPPISLMGVILSISLMGIALIFGEPSGNTYFYLSVALLFFVFLLNFINLLAQSIRQKAFPDKAFNCLKKAYQNNFEEEFMNMIRSGSWSRILISHSTCRYGSYS